jgi:pyrimidine operon attenuation protein/uracil phosphoribosyltransferase
MPEKKIMSEQEITRALTRLAHEVMERNKRARGLLFVGLRTRGGPLAQRIAAAIKEFGQEDIPVGALDISLYRDDLSSLGAKTVLQPSDIPTDIEGKRVILVDDVLYTGRSTRAAMDAIVDFGRPERIQLLVLIDRGHRELPIRPDYVGKNMPSSRKERVQVRLKEIDGRDEVVVIDLQGEDLSAATKAPAPKEAA